MIFYSINKTIRNFLRVKIYYFTKKDKNNGNGLSGNRREDYRKWQYKDGSLKGEGFVKEGKLEGIATLYHENGNIKAREFYKDDQLHGLSKWYYQSGELQSEKYYKDNKLLWIKEYGKNGKLLHLREWDSDGKLLKDDYSS